MITDFQSAEEMLSSFFRRALVRDVPPATLGVRGSVCVPWEATAWSFGL